MRLLAVKSKHHPKQTSSHEYALLCSIELCKEGGTEGGTDGLMHEQIFGELGFALSKEREQRKRTRTQCSQSDEYMYSVYPLLELVLETYCIVLLMCHPRFIHLMHS